MDLSEVAVLWTGTHGGGLVVRKRVEGIEPSSLAWKAIALPLSYTRIELHPRRASPATVHACPSPGRRGILRTIFRRLSSALTPSDLGFVRPWLLPALASSGGERNQPSRRAPCRTW